jgi:histidine ammonia-lyase
VDSIPTCANTEDHVSMGTIAARKAAEVIRNVRKVVAIEILAANQGLRFRLPLKPGLALRRVLAELRAAGVERLEDDRVMEGDLEAVLEWMETE